MSLTVLLSGQSLDVQPPRPTVIAAVQIIFRKSVFIYCFLCPREVSINLFPHAEECVLYISSSIW